MKRKQKKPILSEQILMSGITTEADIVRQWQRELGRRGGAANSPKQQAHRKQIMETINARRAARIAARKDREK